MHKSDYLKGSIVGYQFLHIYNLFRAFKLQSTGEKVRQAEKNHSL